MDSVVVVRRAEEPATTRRNWAVLPRDVVYEIFCRIPHVDILNGAGLVCASWRRLAVDEPMLWRHIDIAFDWEEYVGFAYEVDEVDFNLRSRETPAGLLAMARAAIDRSAGRCESFHGPIDGHLLLHLATSAPSLRTIHVTSFFRLERGMVDRVVSKLKMLERLVLPRGLVMYTTLRAFVDYCPRLQHLDAGGCYLATTEACCASSSSPKLSQVKVLVFPRQRLPPHEPLYQWMLAWDYYY